MVKIALRIRDIKIDGRWYEAINQSLHTEHRLQPSRRAHQPDALVETDVTTLRELDCRGRSLDDALSTGDLVLEGDHQIAARFLTCFRRPA